VTKSVSGSLLFRRAVRWTLIAAVVLAIGAAAVGYLVAQERGLWSGLAGVALAVVFFVLTPVSILIAQRFHESPLYAQVSAMIVMGSWLLKFVVFICAILVLRGQEWVVPGVLFGAMVAGVVMSLAIDVFTYLSTRVPYTGEVELPESANSEEDS
jgi:hypothetical protein